MTAAASLLILQSVPSFAQPATGRLSLTAAELAPICMQRPFGNGPHVADAARGQMLRIVVAAMDVKSLENRGFSQVDCQVADLATLDRKHGWRDTICTLAATGNEAVQRQLTDAYGASPAVLCGSAELVAGAWQRGHSGN